MYIYKKTLPLKGWTFGATKYDSHPAGTFSKIFMGGSTFAFYSNSGSSSFRKEYVVDVFDIVKNEAGDKYVSVDEFDTATDGFFVKAPIDGGNADELQGYSAAEIIALGQTIPEANRFANYSALPLPTVVIPYTLFGVAASQGSVILFNYKEAGVYYSTGLTWVFSGFPVMEVEPANPNIQSHISSTSNPHSVTASQVGSYTSGQIDTLLSGKEDNLAFVAQTNNKYLRDDNSFQTIEQAVGGYANNLYFAETASDVAGYETLSYEPEVSTTIESWSVTSTDGDKLLKNYIYPTAVGTTSIPAGLWSIAMFGKVSSATSVTQMGITYFARHIDNSETDLFTVWSDEINNTVDDWIQFQITNQAFALVSTDRMGARVKIKTTSTGTRTVTYAVGDGFGAFINNPNKIRHNQLRSYNEDVTVQHIDSNTEKATIIDADSLVIWDSVAAKAVRSTFAHIKTVLQSAFAKLTGGNSFVGNQSINGNVVIDGEGAVPHSVWKLVVGDATTDEAKLYVGRTDVINDETVQTYAAVFRMTPNNDPTGVLFSRVNYGGISIGTGTSNGFGIATTDNSGANPVDMIEFGTQGTTATTRWLMLGTGSVYSLDANKIVGSTADTVIQNNVLNDSRVVARVAGTSTQSVDLFDVGILANSTTFNKKFTISKDGNTSGNNFINRRETQATTGGTTTLTVANAQTQEFTGTQNQTVVLPVVSTLLINTTYRVSNQSTGVITVQSSGGNTILTIPSGYICEVRCILITGTTAASWSYSISQSSDASLIVKNLSVIASVTLPYIEKTADYTLTDLDYTVNCTANTFNITLPTAVGKQGRIYNIKNTGLGTITVNTTSSETIDGELTQRLVKPTNMQVQSTNTNWIIL